MEVRMRAARSRIRRSVHRAVGRKMVDRLRTRGKRRVQPFLLGRVDGPVDRASAQSDRSRRCPSRPPGRPHLSMGRAAVSLRARLPPGLRNRRLAASDHAHVHDGVLRRARGPAGGWTRRQRLELFRDASRRSASDRRGRMAGRGGRLVRGAANVTLFSSIAIGSASLKNRTAVAPMTRVSAAEDGRITGEMVDYYEEFARGGWGLVETEATYIDEEHSQCRPHQPGIATIAQRDGWRRVVDAVHARGAAIFIQLQHAGALAEARRYRADTVAPSAIEPRCSKPLPIPRELTGIEIARIHESFGRAAAYASEAGFDGIELHGTNGYLIDQFLTDYTNLRGDRYGGSFVNRTRFACEATAAVRSAVPGSFPVGMRLNQAKKNDAASAWTGGEADASALFGGLAAAGATFLHIAGLNASPPARGSDMLLDAARAVANVVVIANGGLEDPARAHAIVGSGRADMVSLARGALANSDWPE